MIRLQDILNEALNEQKIINIAKEFMNSESYNSNHDCKRSTFEFIKWAKKNKGFEPDALLLAPPKDIKMFPGKSGDGDSHIFAIIDGFGVDFTTNQFPGVSEPLKITPESQIPSEYKKIGGYYTNFPDWFENGKTSIKSKFNNLPQWFRDGFEKEGFKPELDESIDKTAGVWDTNEKFKDGSDFKIKFKVSDIIDLAKNTPVKEIDPKSIKYNFSGRQDSDPGKTKERVMKADLSYPIIAVKNENGKIFAMLDGTHRLEKALNLGLDKIKTKVLDKEDLIQFKTDKLKEIKLIDIAKEILNEDRCKRIADRRYDKPSAYKSGAIVRCRKGKIWKGLKEDWQDTSWTGEKGQKITLTQLLDVIKDYPIVQAPIDKVEKIIIKKDSGGIESDRLSAADTKYPIIIIVDDNGNYKYVLDGNHRANRAVDAGLKSIPAKLVNIKKLPQEFQDVLDEAKKETLRTWFKRKGAPGKTGGWVDCNTCREVDGKTKCKPCGRQKGEKRAKYPSCRPTPSACKQPGKGKKWGKTK